MHVVNGLSIQAYQIINRWIHNLKLNFTTIWDVLLHGKSQLNWKSPFQGPPVASFYYSLVTVLKILSLAWGSQCKIETKLISYARFLSFYMRSDWLNLKMLEMWEIFPRYFRA